MSKRIPIRVILPGGGVKAVFQAGFMQELLNTNLFEIDRVYGCSAGALVAPLVVTNRIPELFEVLKDIKSIEDITEPWPYLPSTMKNNIFTVAFNKLYQIMGPDSIFRRFTSIVYLFFNFGLYKRMSLVDDIMSRFTPQDKRMVEQKVEVVAYDVLNHNTRWFSKDEIFVGIQASSALWLVVPPVKYKGNYYSDGGGIELYPLEHIDPKFPGLHLVVDLNPEKREPLKKLPRDVVSLVYDMANNTISTLARERLATVSKMLKNKMIIVHPDEQVFSNFMDFNQKSVLRAFDAGRIKFHQFMLEYLPTISKLSGTARA